VLPHEQRILMLDLSPTLHASWCSKISISSSNMSSTEQEVRLLTLSHPVSQLATLSQSIAFLISHNRLNIQNRTRKPTLGKQWSWGASSAQELNASKALPASDSICTPSANSKALLVSCSAIRGCNKSFPSSSPTLELKALDLSAYSLADFAFQSSPSFRWTFKIISTASRTFLSKSRKSSRDLFAAS